VYTKVPDGSIITEPHPVGTNPLNCENVYGGIPPETNPVKLPVKIGKQFPNPVLPAIGLWFIKIVTGKSAKQPLLAVTRIVTLPITVGFGKLITFGVNVKSAVVADVGVTDAVPFTCDPTTTENVSGNKPGDAVAVTLPVTGVPWHVSRGLVPVIVGDSWAITLIVPVLL
jgi:hypothetical protein